MAGNNNNNSSYDTSWADQWDPQPAYGSYDNNDGDGKNKNNKKKNNKDNNGASAGAKKKVEEGLAKTKDVASSGFKKVKQGTSFGLTWIKDKYHNTTQKH